MVGDCLHWHCGNCLCPCSVYPLSAHTAFGYAQFVDDVNPHRWGVFRRVAVGRIGSRGRLGGAVCRGAGDVGGIESKINQLFADLLPKVYRGLLVAGVFEPNVFAPVTRGGKPVCCVNMRPLTGLAIGKDTAPVVDCFFLALT